MGDVVVVLSGDERRLLDSLNRVIDREQKLRDAARDAGDAGDQANRKVSRSSSDVERGIKGIVSQMTPWALGVAAVQKAYQGVTDVIRDMTEEQRKSAEQIRAAGEGLAKLMQLAGGQPGRMAALGKDTRDFFGVGGAKTMTEAAETVFALDSASLNTEENRKLIADLGGAVQDKPQAINAASKIKAAFGDKAGSLRDILGEVFRASKESPDTPEALLSATARSATYAKEAGLDDEEALASVTMLSKEAGADVAGTRLSGFLRVLSGPGAKGKGKGLLKRVIDRGGGMADVLDELERKGLTDHKAFAKAFGDDSEAFAGLKGLLGHKEELRTLVKAERDAQTNDYVASVIASRNEDPDVKLEHEDRIAENQEQLDNEREGQLRAKAELRAKNHALQLRKWGVPKFVTRRVQKWEEDYQDDPLGANQQYLGLGVIPGTFMAPMRYFDEQELEEQERRAGQARQSRIKLPPVAAPGPDSLARLEEHMRRVSESNEQMLEHERRFEQRNNRVDIGHNFGLTDLPPGGSKIPGGR